MGMTFAAADAADKITVPSGARLNALSAWSVEYLFKTTSSNTNNWIYSEADDSTGDPFLTIGTHNGRAIFQFRGTSSAIQIYPATAYNDGAWHHAVAIRRSASDWELYVNGASIGTTTSTADTGTFTNSFIGNLKQGPTNYWFQGSIGFVRTYASVLSVAEIAALNTVRGGRPWSTIRAEWMLDDHPAGTNASTAVDTGPNGYHGTVAGTPVSIETPLSAPQRGA